jgi:hypothetical protein
MNLSHFEAMALFALIVSVALAMLSRRTLRGRIRYAAGAFLAFLLIAIAVAWLMYLAAE